LPSSINKGSQALYIWTGENISIENIAVLYPSEIVKNANSDFVFLIYSIFFKKVGSFTVSLPSELGNETRIKNFIVKESTVY